MSNSVTINYECKDGWLHVSVYGCPGAGQYRLPVMYPELISNNDEKALALLALLGVANKFASPHIPYAIYAAIENAEHEIQEWLSSYPNNDL